LIKTAVADETAVDTVTDEPRAVFKDARTAKFDRDLVLKRLKRVVEVRQIEMPEKRVRFLQTEEENLELKVETEDLKLADPTGPAELPAELPVTLEEKEEEKEEKEQEE
jgi:hypothetical protein